MGEPEQLAEEEGEEVDKFDTFDKTWYGDRPSLTVLR